MQKEKSITNIVLSFIFQANQLDTSPYMLIFGGKEKQGTNFGIKPLTVWKCQIKKS